MSRTETWSEEMSEETKLHIFTAENQEAVKFSDHMIPGDPITIIHNPKRTALFLLL